MGTKISSRKKSSRREDIMLAAAFAILGLVFTVIGISLMVKVNRYKSSCTETDTAMVVRTETKNGKHKQYRAVLIFSTKDGHTVNAVTPWSAKKYKENESVEIFYDPDSPENVYVESHPPYSGSGGVMMPVTGVSFIAFSVMILVTDRKGRRRTSRKVKKKEKL